MKSFPALVFYGPGRGYVKSFDPSHGQATTIVYTEDKNEADYNTSARTASNELAYICGKYQLMLVPIRVKSVVEVQIANFEKENNNEK